jgi:predicted Zn-dependent protease
MPARRLLTAMLTAGFVLSAGAQDDVRLPDLGSSAGTVLSPEEASQYGAGMLHQMRAMDLVLDDPLVSDYINDVGYRLVAHSDNPKLKFTFFVVRDKEINAFAAPGGYIGVNAGLIDLASSESELAGVMAHEIGHITQHHLERAFEASKKDAPLMALVLLGAIAAGSGSNSGDAGMAVLAGGQGLIAQRQINFTRKDEIEADRVGIETLAKAGYDPTAMAGFFQRMADYLRPGGGGDDVPALLQSHPVTSERISEARARAHTLEQTHQWATARIDNNHWLKTTAPIAFVKDPAALLAGPKQAAGGLPIFPLMRERVRVLSDDATRMASWYAQNLAHQHGFDTPANRYGYALALTRSGRGSKAVTLLQPLLTKYPASLPLRLAMADAELDAGQRAAALAIYADLSAGSPGNRAIAIAYAHALLQDNNAATAGKAAALLKPLLDDSDEPDIYQTYARASERAGDTARAAEAYADASYLSGRPFDAMEQLRRLLKRTDLDYYQRARVQARIAELTPIVLELHKRHVKTEDSGEQPFAPAAGESCAGRLCFGIEGH